MYTVLNMILKIGKTYGSQNITGDGNSNVVLDV